MWDIDSNSKLFFGVQLKEMTLPSHQLLVKVSTVNMAWQLTHAPMGEIAICCLDRKVKFAMVETVYQQAYCLLQK